MQQTRLEIHLMFAEFRDDTCDNGNRWLNRLCMCIGLSYKKTQSTYKLCCSIHVLFILSLLYSNYIICEDDRLLLSIQI